jgi:cardiolipin synthase
VRHIPNLICLIRLVLVWPVAAALHDGRYGLALGLFVAAALSDGLDGFLAKRFNWVSELGKVLDPAADKLLLVVVFVESAWLGLVPWWITAAAVARDVMIALGALAFKLWVGPLRGRPTVISKINTAAQLLYLAGVMCAATLLLPYAGVVRAAGLVVFVTTVLSGLDYLITFARRAWTAPPRPA